MADAELVDLVLELDTLLPDAPDSRDQAATIVDALCLALARRIRAEQVRIVALPREERPPLSDNAWSHGMTNAIRLIGIAPYDQRLSDAAQ